MVNRLIFWRKILPTFFFISFWSLAGNGINNLPTSPQIPKVVNPNSLNTKGVNSQGDHLSFNQNVLDNGRPYFALNYLNANDQLANDDEHGKNILLTTWINNKDQFTFSFPKEKRYKLESGVYQINDFRNQCYYQHYWYKNPCAANKVSKYTDELITYKPVVLIASLKKGNWSPPIKYRPQNLGYNDWNLQSVIDGKNKKWYQDHSQKVDWKSYYGYFEKNALDQVYVYPKLGEKSNFSAETYNLSVDRNVKYGNSFPIFNEFWKRRKAVKIDTLGFESYDEINWPLSQLLERNKTSSLPLKTIVNNPAMNFYVDTQSNYGWSNAHYTWYAKSYLSAKEVVELMTTGIDNNYGAEYLSWESDIDYFYYANLYTLVPLAKNPTPYVMSRLVKPTVNINVDAKKEVIDQNKDLFYVNYDRLVTFKTPEINNNTIIYPFALDYKRIKKDKIDLVDFFNISSHFNFYLNYTYQKQNYKSVPYQIQDLINDNAIILNNFPNLPTDQITNLYLSIEPKNQQQVDLMFFQTQPRMWQFDLSVASNDKSYELNDDQSLNKITIQTTNQRTMNINEFKTRDFFPSELLYYENLSQIFELNQDQLFKISPSNVDKWLQPQVIADDQKGEVTIKYYDYYKNNQQKTLTVSNTKKLPQFPTSHQHNFWLQNSKLVKNNLLTNYLTNLFSWAKSKYWNDHIKFEFLTVNDLDPKIIYQLKVEGFDNQKQIKRQWENVYHNQKYEITNLFTIAPKQKTSYLQKAPTYYSNTSPEIWSQWLELTTDAVKLGIQPSDFTVSVEKNHHHLKLTLQINKQDFSGRKSYIFYYDVKKLTDGLKQPTNPPSGYGAKTHSEQSSIPTTNSFWTTPTNRYVLVGSAVGGVFLALTFFAIKGMTNLFVRKKPQPVVI